MKKGILSIVPAAFFFNAMEIALKFSSGSFSAVQLALLRFLIGGLILLPPAAREIRREKGAFRRNGVPGGAER